MEQLRPPRCDEPFDGGPGLCRACKVAPDALGLRRCSRVVAESPAMKAVLARIVAIAAAQAPVVVQGETGTGKEVLARLLQVNGPRRNKRFVAVNVAALPAELLESELFGHVRGAFTGAHSAKVGLFEAADGGTLFLDEISEMSLPLQAKLLRALQQGEIRRVGDTKTFAVNVRIICATHRNLADQVARGLFRDDLFYRLKVFTVTLPPLRERVDDVMPLARMFASREMAPGSVPEFADSAVRCLKGYRWPGNVRELENTMRHAVALAGEGPIDTPHLPPEVTTSPTRAPSVEVLRSLAEVEREHIARVLEACGGNQVHAARILGIARNTLWRKMKSYQIQIDA